MNVTYSLAFLTVGELPPDEAIHVAADAGYDMVGLRFLPAALSGEGPYPVLTDSALQTRVANALRDTEIKLADIEIARLGATTKVEDFRTFLALGERFGAQNVLVAGDDPDPERLTTTFAAFCDLAADHGLTADLEFMPWTGVKTLADAQRIVDAAGRKNGGVLVDALHWDRSGGKLAEVAALPARLIHYAQICDGPVPYDPSDAGMIAVARGARMVPGTGGIDLSGLMRALPEDIVVSVEVPDLGRSPTISASQHAFTCLRAAQTILATR